MATSGSTPSMVIYDLASSARTDLIVFVTSFGVGFSSVSRKDLILPKDATMA